MGSQILLELLTIRAQCPEAVVLLLVCDCGPPGSRSCGDIVTVDARVVVSPKVCCCRSFLELANVLEVGVVIWVQLERLLPSSNEVCTGGFLVLVEAEVALLGCECIVVESRT